MWLVIIYNDFGSPALTVPCQTQTQAKAIGEVAKAKGREWDMVSDELTISQRVLGRTVGL